MSRKVCFTDSDGQHGTCTREDEDCSKCECIPDDVKEEAMTEEKICPFSMSHPYRVVGRPCIKDECMAWVSEEKTNILIDVQQFPGTTPGHCKLIERGA